jgi:arylsulfatase A-like enzyme
MSKSRISRRQFLAGSLPGVVASGSETDAMISLVDLLPTCIEAAGGEAVEDTGSNRR